MGDNADAGELADLRARAYGPAASGLTAAEQTRLAELERAARPPRSPQPGPVAAVSESEQAVPAPAARPSQVAGAHAAGAPATAKIVDAPDPLAAPEVIRLRPSRGYLVALVAAAALVPVAAIGGFIGGGWMAGLGGSAPEPTMLGRHGTQEVEASLGRIRGGQAWDRGRPELLGGTADALVWWGTVDDGAQTCVVLDVTDVGAMPVCGPTEGVRETGLGGVLTAMVRPDPEDLPAGDGATPIEVDHLEIVFTVNPYAGSFAVSTRPAD